MRLHSVFLMATFAAAITGCQSKSILKPPPPNSGSTVTAKTLFKTSGVQTPYLNGDELQKTFSGSRVRYEDGEVVRYQKNGTTVSSNAGSQTTGTWKIAGNRLCVYSEGKTTTCHNVERRGGDLIWIRQDGSPRRLIEITSL